MSFKCNYCINKKQCNECHKDWKDKFIPSKEVKNYFKYVYVGVRGMNGFIYQFDNTNESLIPTHHILIGNNYYCPYCGESMYSIQDRETLTPLGYCCICQGARDEIIYEKEKKELENKYKDELNALKMKYKEKLSFCSDKLFEIKQKQERERFDFFHNKYTHFSTINGKTCSTINQIAN